MKKETWHGMEKAMSKFDDEEYVEKVVEFRKLVEATAEYSDENMLMAAADRLADMETANEQVQAAIDKLHYWYDKYFEATL